MTRGNTPAVWLALACALIACNSRARPRDGVDGGPRPFFDGGSFDGPRPPDGGVDGGPVIRIDGGPGFDGGAGVDGGPGFDGGSGVDGGPIIRIDGGWGFDSGRRDAGPPPPGCDVGNACDPTRGCVSSPYCIDEFDGEIGGSSDPIMGLPGGGTAIPYTAWVDGYCSNVAAIDSGGCDPLDDLACGGPACGVCLNSGQTSVSGSPVTYCTRACAPSLTSNPCRDTYACILGNDVCVPGCASHNECRVHRVDTNLNGRLDPYDATTNPGGDRLAYDASTSAMCNFTTYRCTHNGTAGADAGDPCFHDFQCERNGDCVPDDGPPGNWPGGYCTKFGCDVPGNACAGGGKCQSRGLGISMCTDPCQVARTTSATDRFAPPRDCRAGYACFWDGVLGAVADNGACVPGNYNSVRTPNIGATCTTEASCYSPYGLGQCRDFGAGLHCTLFDCGAPGMPADVCGSAALCASVTGSTTTLCMETCTSASTCLPGSGCWDTTAAGIETGGVRVCFPGCLASADCRAGETCVGASATTVGTCS
jgi:hypothetical protein